MFLSTAPRLAVLSSRASPCASAIVALPHFQVSRGVPFLLPRGETHFLRTAESQARQLQVDKVVCHARRNVRSEDLETERGSSEKNLQEDSSLIQDRKPLPKSRTRSRLSFVPTSSRSDGDGEAGTSSEGQTVTFPGGQPLQGTAGLPGSLPAYQAGPTASNSATVSVADKQLKRSTAGRGAANPTRATDWEQQLVVQAKARQQGKAKASSDWQTKRSQSSSLLGAEAGLPLASGGGSGSRSKGSSSRRGWGPKSAVTAESRQQRQSAALRPTESASAMGRGRRKEAGRSGTAAQVPAAAAAVAVVPSNGAPPRQRLAQNRLAYVQVLGTGLDTGDTSACVLLFFEGLRVVLNAGEGLQRFCLEHRVRLAKVDRILLSRVGSETAGGLPGLLLTLANTGEEGLSVHVCGPSDLRLLSSAMRCFVGAASVRTSCFGVQPDKGGGGAGAAQAEGGAPGAASAAAGVSGLAPFAGGDYPHALLPGAQQLGEGEERAGAGAPLEGGKEAAGSGAARQPAEDSDAFVVHSDGEVHIVAVMLRPEGSGGEGGGGDKGGEGAEGQSRDALGRGEGEGTGVVTGSSGEGQEEGGSASPHADAGSPGRGGRRKRVKVGEPEANGTGTGRSGQQQVPVPAALRGAGGDGGQAEEGEGAALEGAAAAVSAVFVCRLPRTAGKFDPQKAAAAGVRPGPKYRQLQSGAAVEADDGSRMVHPHEVMAPPLPGPVLLLVDCPSARHIPPLLRSPQLAPFLLPHPAPSQSNGGPAVPPPPPETATVVIHLSPQSVVETAEYQRWMARFGRSTHHILAGHGRSFLSPPTLASSAAMTARLHAVCPPLFPPLPEAAAGPAAEELLPAADAATLGPVTVAQNLLKFNLRSAPVLGIDTSSVPPPFSAARALSSLSPETLAAAKQLSTQWAYDTAPSTSPLSEADATSGSSRSSGSSSSSAPVPACLLGLPRDSAEVVFLGTGSSQPSKHRGLSAVLLRRFRRGSLLMDCGEGTLGQMMRRFGPAATRSILSGLRLVWVSHIHADHHTGLVRVLAARRDVLLEAAREAAAAKRLEATTAEGGAAELGRGAAAAAAAAPPAIPPVLVVGPRQLQRYVEAYSRLENLHCCFLDCSQTTREAEELARAGGRRKGLVAVGGSARGEGGGGGGPRAEGATPLDTSAANPSRGLRPFWTLGGYHLEAGLDEQGRAYLGEVLAGLGLRRLESVPVVHCPQAFAAVVEALPEGGGKGGSEEGGAQRGAAGETRQGPAQGRGGWSVVYSGDTRPCAAVVEAARDATLLIHEATFDDSLQEEAVARRHSTTSEAVAVGAAAGAFRTILTHFSQRYPKIPNLATLQRALSRTQPQRGAAGGAGDARRVQEFPRDGPEGTSVKNEGLGGVAIAFDLMAVNMADLPKLPLLMPVLQTLFAEAADDGDLPEDGYVD